MKEALPQITEMLLQVSETKHTPGPWKATVPPSSCLTCRFIESEEGHIAKIGHMDFTSGSQASDIANARLIAAAPDLLAALREACEAYGCECIDTEPRPHCPMCLGRAAIAKAEGSAQ